MIKTFLKVIAGLVVLIVIAVAGFVYTFDANNYKEEITELAESVTGRTIRIAGDMAISLYPWIGIKISEVTIENTPEFSNKTFATIGQFDVRIKFIPLLQKRLDIDKLVLHRLVANFEINSAGENNWSDVAGLSETDDMKSEFGLTGLSVGGIDLADSSVSWLDVNTGKQLKVSKMSMSTKAINQGQPLPVELKALVESNQPEWMAAINAKAKLEFNEDAAVFDVNGLKMSVNALLPGTGMGKVKIAMVTDSTINLQTQTAKLSKAKLGAFGLVTGGTFDVENIFSVPVIQGPIKVKTFDMATLAKHLKFDMPQMANEQSLNQISLTALFKTDFDTVQLDNIAANIDESKVKGFMSIAVKSQPEVRYQLKADKINLDDYRIIGNEVDKGKLPLDFIRAADIEGVLDVETASLNEIELQQLHIASNIENDLLKVNPITMRMNEAEVRAAMQLDAREIPAVSLTVEVRQVDANDSINLLLNNIIGDEAPTLKGLANVDVNLNAAGSNVTELKTSAKGTVKLAMDKVSITGIDFDHASHAVVVDYAERNDFKVSRTFNAEYVPDSTTEFNSLSASFKVSKGRLVNNDLLMVSDQVNVTGSGNIDFINAKLEYRPEIDMNLKSTVNVRDKLRDHPMQYHTHGRFGDLITEFNVDRYDLHMGRLMIQEAKAHKNRRINSQSQNKWQNVLSK